MATEKTNQQNDRVLGRRRARIITMEEARITKGGKPLHDTFTACSADIRYGLDGDPNEC